MATRSKLAVILHADVVGSTALVQKDERLAHDRIQDVFRRLAEIISVYGGETHELRGDALLAGFNRASDAVSAALKFQGDNAAHNANRDDEILPMVRVGLALGEVVIADDTLTGPDVVLAQRLEQLAAPGGVCASQAVFQSTPRRLPFDYDDLGEHNVKGFTEPVRVYSVELRQGEEAPEPEPESPGSSVDAAIATRSNRRTLAAVVVVLIAIGSGFVWWQQLRPEFEPAAVERVAFPLPDRPSIAVLPFDNLSDDPQQEYLSDGLTNDIITDLSKFNDVFVIASNSSFSYKDKPVKVQQVAEELGVRYVLEGSFQMVGQRLRINAQLIDATTGHHLWAERYDRNASDFFVIQESILQTIVASLASQVDAAEVKRVLSKSTENLKAYDYYQRGNEAFRQWTRESNNQALELIEKAIELDPDYARAYSALTWIHANNSSGRYSWGENPDRSMGLVLEVARKAVELAPEDYYTHWALGFAHVIHGDFDRAEAGYQRAFALNPNDDLLLATMVELLIKLGRAEQAIAQMKLAMRINPRHPDWYFWDLGWAQYTAGHYEEALANLNKMSNPPNGVRRVRAAVLVRLGRAEEAREVMSKFIETDIDMTLDEMETFAWKDREGLNRWIADLRVAGLPENRSSLAPDIATKNELAQ
jgi:adenylate cyclase